MKSAIHATVNNEIGLSARIISHLGEIISKITMQ